MKEDEKWFQVSLRLRGDNLDVDEVEATLGIEPSFISRRDEHINSNPRYAKYHTNVWGWIFTEDSTVSFEQQIGDVLDILEPKKSDLKELLSFSGIDGELFLGFSSGNGQGGAYFSSLLLERVSLLGLALSLDLYPSSTLGEIKSE